MSVTREKEVRAGVFTTVEQTQKAVTALTAAGFSTDQISVVCSDHAKADHFSQFVHQEPAGAHDDEALSTAGATALGLGGAAVVGAALTGGGALLAIGAFAGIASLGTFVSLMSTRGVEKEAADFYDQALQGGDLLVAVELESENTAGLEKAERILTHNGARVFDLPEG